MSRKVARVLDFSPEESWGTFDLGVASALVTVGFKLAELDRSSDIRKVQFVFIRDKKTDIEEVANSYWNGELTVDARKFFDNIKAIKNRVYSA